MNPLWVTQTGGRAHTDPKAIQHDWDSGLEFRIYRYATMITKAKTARLLVAGFTHLRVVYQREDMSVVACNIDLKAHARH